MPCHRLFRFCVALPLVALALTLSPALAAAQDLTDRDGDGMPDAWEIQFGLNPGIAVGDDGAAGDPDGDGRSNLLEYQLGTHPRGVVARYFAEGATGPMFDCRFALFNPTAVTARTLLRFLRADGVTLSQVVTLAPQARGTVNPETVPGLDNAAFSTIVEADAFVVADRTMQWDSTHYGSHTETGVVAPAFTWYLAEGATHSGFDLFYLIANPGDTAAGVSVTYLLPSGTPVVRTYDIGPRSRFNIWVNREATALASTDVSAVVTATVPVIVERAMYLSRGAQLFAAGHESAGVTTPSPSWFLAEGATGSYFDLYVLMANPSTHAVTADTTFLLPDGTTVERSYTIGAQSRFTVWVDAEDARLADTAVATTVRVRDGTPIIVERAMWWPGSPATWSEAHNSPGATTAARRWALADGEDGGLGSTETYVLVANTSSHDGDVTFTVFLEGGGVLSSTHRVAANSRHTVNVADEFPDAKGRRFSVEVEATGSNPVDLVVERAMYQDANGVPWAGGTDALGAIVPPGTLPGGSLGSLPVVTVEATDAWSAEGGADTGTVTFRRSGDLAEALTVAYYTAGTAQDAGDVVHPSGTVTFAAGAATAAVVVSPVDDALAEPPETFIVSLFSGTTYGVGSQGHAQVLVRDNDVEAIPATLSDAARFLTQATFGPTLAEIDRVQTMGYEAWLNEQVARPASSFVGFLDGVTGEDVDEPHLQEAWVTHAMVGQDQLRQRVANALLEILVVSDHNGLEGASYSLATYMDVLQTHAFGTYRELLEAVTLNPAMGKYLDMLKNRKEDAETGRRPNENYAREILQLFSIGLYQLNLDGTLKVDPAGMPIPTYTQETVEGFARVFTGWTFRQTVEPFKFWAPANWREPMMAMAAYHSTGTKLLLDGVVLPAGQTPEQDLEAALDNIASHPNVAPFISRQLIQRLVTDNPSRDYVRRVATVFTDNGSGIRGDLRAVVRAILLDPEARDVARSRKFDWGKLREPMIKFVTLARAFNARAASGTFGIWNLEHDMEQGPFRSPSVFNFFEPNYQPPGLLRDLDLYAPEFQIMTESAVIQGSNTLRSIVNGWYGWPVENQLKFDLTTELQLVSTPTLLVDRLDRLLFSGGMSSDLRRITLDLLATLSKKTADKRVKAAIVLLARSPEWAVQR